MARLHPGLDQAEAERLERRVSVCWGQMGLNYEEAPLRADGLRQWYPVRRNGRLQRIPLPELTVRERDEIVAEMKSQAEHALARAAALQDGTGSGQGGQSHRGSLRL